jgi:hypothetical protein
MVCCGDGTEVVHISPKVSLFGFYAINDISSSDFRVFFVTKLAQNKVTHFSLMY